MTHHVLALLTLAVLSHCAEPPAARAPSQAGDAAPAPAPAASSPTPAPPPAPSSAVRDAAVPELSTPNALAVPKADAGTEAEALVGDPRMAGIRRIGVAAQDCHARHAPGVKGRLTLRIAPDHAGAVKSASVVRAQSSAELARPAFESCVLDAVKRERLSPARDEDDELELPLTFEPSP